MNVRLLAHLIFAILAATAFAGCADNSGDEPTDTTPTTTTPMTPTDETPEEMAPHYTLNATGFPKNVTAGMAWNFTLTVDGAPMAATTHLGAHYGPVTVVEPSLDLYNNACDHHTNTTVPNTVLVTCNMTEAGDVYLRGHLRMLEGETTKNYWSAEKMITVKAAMPAEEHGHNETAMYTVKTAGLPVLPVVAGQNFTFQVIVEGNHTANSTHIAAHYGNMSSESPSLTVYNNLCMVVEGQVPGSFDITCNVANAGTIYLRGHMMMTMDTVTTHYWSAESSIIVA